MLTLNARPSSGREDPAVELLLGLHPSFTDVPPRQSYRERFPLVQGEFVQSQLIEVLQGVVEKEVPSCEFGRKDLGRVAFLSWEKAGRAQRENERL